MTANIVLVLVFDSGARNVPDRLLSVGFSGLTASLRRNQNAEPKPRAAVVMAAGAATVKETGQFLWLAHDPSGVRSARSVRSMGDSPWTSAQGGLQGFSRKFYRLRTNYAIDY
jgi:hypothetical protein